MADRDHEDHRSFGEKLFGRHEHGPDHDRDRDHPARGAEQRSWGDDQGSGFSRELYRGDNEPRGYGDGRHDQGHSTYGARDVSESSRRSNFRQDNRYDDSGFTARGGGSGRPEDQYGAGRRDFSRFEPNDRDRDRDPHQGAGTGSRTYGAGGYEGGGYGQSGYGAGGYGGNRGQDRLGGADPQGSWTGGRGREQNRGGQQFYGEHNQVGGDPSRGGSGYGAGSQGQRQGQHQGGDHEHDLEPHYRDWRDRRLADYDRDYNHWRETQAKKHDDEYRSWRDQRRGEFHNEFETWRSSRNASQGGGGQPQPGAHGEGDLTGHGQGQGLPQNARPGAPARESTWSSGAGGGTGQGQNRGGGSLAQGVPNGGIAPGGGNYGEEFAPNGVTTAGGFNADTTGVRAAEVPLHSSGDQPPTGASQAQSQTASTGVDAAVGDNAALHNVAGGHDNRLNPDRDKKDDDRKG